MLIFFILEGTVLDDFLGTEFITSVDDINIRELRQVDSFLYRRIPAADYNQLFAFEECPITDGTIGNAAAVVLILSGNAQFAVVGTCSDDDGTRFIGFFACFDDAVIPIHDDALHVSVCMLGSELHGTFVHPFG